MFAKLNHGKLHILITSYLFLFTLWLITFLSVCKQKKSNNFLYLSEKSSAICNGHLVSKAFPLTPIKVKIQQGHGMPGCCYVRISLRAGPGVWSRVFAFVQTGVWVSGEVAAMCYLSPNKTRHKQMSTTSPFFPNCKTFIRKKIYQILYVLWIISRFLRFNWGEPLPPQSPQLLIFPSFIFLSFRL